MRGAARSTFDGATLTAMPCTRRASSGIGYMPEDRRLIPDLTVEENVLLPAWATGLDDDGRAARPRSTSIIPEAQAFAPAQGAATFRRSAEARGAGARADVRHRACCCSTSRSKASRRCSPAPRRGDRPTQARGLSVILSESDLSHSRDLLDLVFTIDRGEINSVA